MFDHSRRNLAHWFALSMGGILFAFAGVGYCLSVEEQLRVFDDELFSQSKAFAVKTQYSLYQSQWQNQRRQTPVESDASLNGGLMYARWYNSNKQLLQFIGSSGGKQLTAKPGFQTLEAPIDLKSSSSSPSELGGVKGKGEGGKGLNPLPFSLSPFPSPHPAFLGWQTTSTRTWVRQVTLPVLEGKVLIGYFQTAVPMNSLRVGLNQARLFLTFGVPVTFGVIGITGWFLGGLAMRPSLRAYQQLQQFTADASHELRAPVATVLSNAQVALMPPEDPVEQRLRLQNIVQTAKSMSTLINDLLFLSRHNGSLAETVLKPVDLCEILRSLAQEFAAQAPAQNLNFNAHLPEYPIMLKADANLLKQAVINLLTNAFKYTSADGKVELYLFTQSHSAVIQVKDNGIGIPSTDLPHIFDRFYRVDTVRSRQTGGFGLGLAIAQQIVQRYGGQITVNSILGQGSTFQISLPLKL